ncbi:MAG: spermidine synthase [bacterium JZ-2024 1]
MDKIVYQKKVGDFVLKVVDRENTRFLLFNETEQSAMSLSEPHRGKFEYMDFFHLPWLLKIPIRNVLFIGLGGGSIPKSYHYYYPDALLDAVEIYPEVAEVARKYFFFEESPRIHLYIMDIEDFLRQFPDKKYDVVIHDAFVVTKDYAGPPENLCSREFYELVKGHLEETGLLMHNITGFWFSYKALHIWKEMISVFPYAWGFNVRSSSNLIYVGSQKPLWDKKTLTEVANQAPYYPALEYVQFSAFPRQLILVHPQE